MSDFFALSYVSAAGQTDPNGPAGDTAASLLIPNITDTRTRIDNLNLPVVIPVGNGDAGGYFNEEVLAASDYGVCDFHISFLCSFGADLPCDMRICSDGQRSPVVRECFHRSGRGVDMGILRGLRRCRFAERLEPPSDVNSRDGMAYGVLDIELYTICAHDWS